jgi:hypothetical protein
LIFVAVVAVAAALAGKYIAPNVEDVTYANGQITFHMSDEYTRRHVPEALASMGYVDSDTFIHDTYYAVPLSVLLKLLAVIIVVGGLGVWMGCKFLRKLRQRAYS